jgi:hypothetical protein
VQSHIYTLTPDLAANRPSSSANRATSCDVRRCYRLSSSASRVSRFELDYLCRRGPDHFKNTQMTKPMIKMATTRAASGLICNHSQHQLHSNRPVRPNDDQIVLRSDGRRAYVI